MTSQHKKIILKEQLSLILLFTKQELFDRYRYSLLGRTWLILQPLIYILIFTLVFSSIMKTRLSDFNDDYAYSIYLVSGLLIWTAASNVIIRLSSVYQDKATLIKKVPINLMVMPLYIPLVEAIIYLISMFLFAIILILVGYEFTWLWLWLPLLLLISLSFAYVVGLLFALLSPFISDIRHAVPVLFQLLFWMTPIIYLPSIIPTSYRWIIDLNPFAGIVHHFQQVIFFKNIPSISTLLITSVISLLLLAMVYKLYTHVEKDIRDLI